MGKKLNRADLDEQTLNRILARLRRVEGQVRAVTRMIEERRDCHEVAHQLGAARAALERAAVQFMTASLIGCIAPGEKGAIDKRELERLGDTFVKILS